MPHTTDRPSKFEIMRRQRRRAERQRSIAEFEELKEEARAFGYDDTGDVVAGLCAKNARTGHRPQKALFVKQAAPRRWWWPFAWSAAR